MCKNVVPGGAQNFSKGVQNTAFANSLFSKKQGSQKKSGGYIEIVQYKDEKQVDLVVLEQLAPEDRRCGGLYIKTNGDYGGHFKSTWQIVVLANKEIQDKLLAIGQRIKAMYQADREALKAPYTEAVLESVPARLRKVKAYKLQLYSMLTDGSWHTASRRF